MCSLPGCRGHLLLLAWLCLLRLHELLLGLLLSRLGAL